MFLKNEPQKYGFIFKKVNPTLNFFNIGATFAVRKVHSPWLIDHGFIKNTVDSGPSTVDYRPLTID